jgi:hypothetical protein
MTFVVTVMKLKTVELGSLDHLNNIFLRKGTSLQYSYHHHHHHIL